MEAICEFKTLREQDMYVCIVTSASITKRNTRISFKGAHKVGKSNLDVRGIKFKNLVIEYFPQGLHETFPNLVTVSICNCGLKVILNRDLIGLQNLELIYLNTNELKSLPSNLFINMTKLRVISFSENQLVNVSSKLLQPFLIKNDLSFVDFRKNLSIDSFFRPNFEGSENSLQQLMTVIDGKCRKPHEIADSFRENVVKGFQDLWKSGRFSDFFIIAGAKEFRVHKNVLAMHSDSFATMFKNKKTISEMKVTDFSPETVEAVLSFMYTGEVSDESNALEMFSLSANCKIEPLKMTCKAMVIKKICPENALDIFTLGFHNDCRDMQQLAFDEIKNMFTVELSDKLMNDPRQMKDLVEGNRNMKRKILEADKQNQNTKRKAVEEFDEILKKCKKNKTDEVHCTV